MPDGLCAPCRSVGRNAGHSNAIARGYAWRPLWRNEGQRSQSPLYRARSRVLRSRQPSSREQCPASVARIMGASGRCRVPEQTRDSLAAFTGKHCAEAVAAASPKPEANDHPVANLVPGLPAARGYSRRPTSSTASSAIRTGQVPVQMNLLCYASILLVPATLFAQGAQPPGATVPVVASPAPSAPTANMAGSDRKADMPMRMPDMSMSMKSTTFLEQIEHHASAGTSAEPNSTPCTDADVHAWQLDVDVPCQCLCPGPAADVRPGR